MLAQTQGINFFSGSPAPGIQPEGLSLRIILDFIAQGLPKWRDNPNRKQDTAETVLTSDLAAYLNQLARHSGGLDILQFRTEIPDEMNKGRAIDLAPSPCGAILIVNGRRYTYSDILIPIECKRFPIPKSKNRDEREYVISSLSSTGGIQRFKAGHHGGAHLIGAMIGYIQEESSPVWFERVTNWIDELSRTGEPGWSRNDLLHAQLEEADVERYRSIHTRQKSLPNIELHHFWLQMNV